MSEWFEQLDAAAQAQQQPTHRLVAGDGMLLVTERGARVLACQLPGVSDNLFFHHPTMLDPAHTDKPFGGDRLWIAPEVGWFWESLEQAREDPGSQKFPPQIDPGQYTTDSASPVHAQLSNRLKLTDVRDGKSIELAVSRQIRAINAPYGLPSDLKCASFAITHILLARGGDDGAIACAWDILQLPPDGTLICPTTADPNQVSEPTSYYEPFGERHVIRDRNAVRFLADSRRMIKMGLKAEHTTGRMAYYRQLGQGLSTLVLRIFAPQPGEPYPDLPRSADKDQRTGGDALQAYNHGEPGPGGFGEMEYHDPAVIVGQGPTTRHGTSVTHVMAGPDDSIRAFGQRLLGVPINPIE
ncbi:MAG: hypothetical protein Kow00105_12140 [Phycisphaeraceae bacterium]